VTGQTAPPHWSSADAAELDVLIDAFVAAAFVHRERCATCSAGGPWCQALTDAFNGIIEWRRTRALRSKAAYLRVLQAELEEQVA